MNKKQRNKKTLAILLSLIIMTVMFSACSDIDKVTLQSSEKETTIAVGGEPEDSDETTVTTAPQTTTTPQTTTAPKTETSASQNDGSSPTYINGILIVNKTYPLPKDYNPGGLTKEVQDAFEIMQEDAAAQGLNLYISSGFRSYNYQTNLYNNYVKKHGQAEADRFSARAGHSEHQTGLSFDLNTIDDSFANTAEGKWVAQNCYKYGFIIRYPKDKESITGYMYEPWHLRYLGKDIAKKVFDSGLTLEEYLNIDSKYSN